MIEFKPVSSSTIFSTLDAHWQWQTLHTQVLPSTNQLLLDYFKSTTFTSPPQANSAWLVVSDRQTLGRGRLGRSWQSDLDHLYASLGIYMAHDLSDLSSLPLVVAFALQQGVTQWLSQLPRSLSAPADPLLRIKWPNDLVAMIAGVPHKWGGVLIEVTQNQSVGNGWFVVIGMGVNISPFKLTSQTAFSLPVCGLKDLHPSASRNFLLAPLMNQVLASILQYRSQGFGFYEKDWQSQMLWLNDPVCLRNHQGEVIAQGVLNGIDSHGALRIGLADQSEQKWVAGDLHLRKWS